MRLPHSLLSRQFFQFNSLVDLLRALGDGLDADERLEIERIAERGLPPVTSERCLAAMMGLNTGFVWSLLTRPARHYRIFSIQKGAGQRSIAAPRVGLKILQKWLSVQIEQHYEPPQHVYGFVRGRSHLGAAESHTTARWILSMDISDYFPSTPRVVVETSLREFGFGAKGAEIISKLSCLNEGLAQGSPCSPVLSNLSFGVKDAALLEIATNHGIRLTRYADDIVFSGNDMMPDDLIPELRGLFAGGPWRISEEKLEASALPKRLKVHGLLVSGPSIRLTKGYRKKIRLFEHLVGDPRTDKNDVRRMKGHIAYAKSVDGYRQK